MNQNIILSIIEIVAGLIIEGIILSLIFYFISNKNSSQQQEFIATELNNIEKQNKNNYEQLEASMIIMKTDIINQIKESASKNE